MATWQIERIAEFREHAGLSSEPAARWYLESYDWNIFAALDNFCADYHHGED